MFRLIKLSYQTDKKNTIYFVFNVDWNFTCSILFNIEAQWNLL